MANTNPVRYDIPLTIRVDQEFLDAIDDLRRRLTPIPSRSEAIRDLATCAAERLKAVYSRNAR
jgi:metal-responsive CopG/Arc/MetJ family transcriptional regulator